MLLKHKSEYITLLLKNLHGPYSRTYVPRPKRLYMMGHLPISSFILCPTFISLSLHSSHSSPPLIHQTILQALSAYHPLNLECCPPSSIIPSFLSFMYSLNITSSETLPWPFYRKSPYRHYLPRSFVSFILCFLNLNFFSNQFFPLLHYTINYKSTGIFSMLFIESPVLRTSSTYSRHFINIC